MIDSLITWSLRNRLIMLLIAGGIIVYGIYAVKNTPVDAIPYLSENQVIIFTEWILWYLGYPRKMKLLKMGSC